MARFVMALAVPARAHDGSPCFVCGSGLELVPIPHSNARLCRACVPKLGEVLSTASFALLEQWFVITAPDERAHHASGGRASWGASAREGSRSTSDDSSANVLARYGLSAPTTDESTRTHLDLAEAYDEMSLVHDAIREAAHVLWYSSADAWAVETSLRVVFRADRARPGSLTGMSRAARELA